MTKLDYLIRTLTRIDSLTGEEREKRRMGLDWPSDGAETMVGVERLENVATLALDVVAQGIPGDFMECGTWKGGVGILMGHILREHNEARRLFIADSFEGCPAPSEKFPQDAKDPHHTFDFLRVSLDQVKANFARYGLDPDNVTFLTGWFKDTLPGPVEKLALLRIDSDMYESTTEALESLYPLVAPGGYVILDDYFNISNCHQAIVDFRERHAIRERLCPVDWCAVYWRKEAQAKREAA